MTILKCDEGLVQLDNCPHCGYLVSWVNMHYENEKPVLCKWCAIEQSIHQWAKSTVNAAFYERVGGLTQPVPDGTYCTCEPTFSHSEYTCIQCGKPYPPRH